MPEQAESRVLKAATVTFLFAFLLIGLLVFRDYGISWDEFATRTFGMMNVVESVPNAASLDSLRAADGPAYERFGPAFEILLVRAELMMQTRDLRRIFEMRHLANFLLFFLGVVLFNQFCRRRFGVGLALLATVSLVVSPVLFSHAFYNVKDIAFLTMFIASMYSLDAMLANPTWRTVAVHAVTTGVLVGTRVIGIFAMLLTVVAALAQRPTRRTLLVLIGYGVLVALVLPVVWPVLRIDPIGIVKCAVLGSTSNPYINPDLFRGKLLHADALPWDYLPTWILITTPIVVTVLFVVGTGTMILNAARRPMAYVARERQRDLIVFCWFFLPVLGCVVLRPVMYDTWRHLFFVYPAMVYLATIGMETIAARMQSYFGEVERLTINAALAVALLLCLSPVVAFMVRNHPYEHVYFNRFAGRDMAEIKQQYELDYWGLSYRKALEYIVRSDTASVIRIQTINLPGMLNSTMLPNRDRARLRFVGMDEPADYFVTNYRFHPQAYPYTHEVYAVRVGNASIVSVFLIRPTP